MEFTVIEACRAGTGFKRERKITMICVALSGLDLRSQCTPGLAVWASEFRPFRA